jgi:tripartite-type tricarboxylate transporter receptor subunit TctC
MYRSTIKTACTAAVCLLALGAWPARGDYPERPIRIVVAYAAGGPGELLARTMAMNISPILKQSVYVDPRPGANGVLGVETVARAPADGYAFYMGVLANVAPVLVKDPPFDILHDFSPVARPLVTSYVLLVNPRFKNLKDLLDQAKANPGKLNFGQSSLLTMFAEAMFEKEAHIQTTKVPYKGAAPVRTALLAGEVDLAVDSASGYKPLADEGKVRALLTPGSRRSTTFPDIPTAAEAGFPNATMDVSVGIWGPKGVPSEAIAKVNQAVNQAVVLQQVKDAYRLQDMLPVQSTPEETIAQLRKDVEFLTQAARIANFKPE